MTSNQLGEDTIQRIAVVTGAARGIGRAIAERLTSDGHRLVLFDRDEAELSQVAERLAASLMIVGDVTTQTDLDRLLQQTAEVAGPIGILVNNAGHSWEDCEYRGAERRRLASRLGRAPDGSVPLVAGGRTDHAAPKGGVASSTSPRSPAKRETRGSSRTPQPRQA